MKKFDGISKSKWTHWEIGCGLYNENNLLSTGDQQLFTFSRKYVNPVTF